MAGSSTGPRKPIQNIKVYGVTSDDIAENKPLPLTNSGVEVKTNSGIENDILMGIMTDILIQLRKINVHFESITDLSISDGDMDL